jgi:hypothetical protein
MENKVEKNVIKPNKNIFISIIEFFFDKTEKLLRYFLPGFVFLFLIKWDKDLSSTIDKIKNLDLLQLIIFPFIFGLLIYTIHRSFFYLIDFIPFKYKSKSFAEYLNFISKRKNKLKNDLYYRGAILHCSIIFFEILFFVNIINCSKENVFYIILSIICFVILSWIKIFMGFVEIESNKIEKTERELKKNKNRKKQKTADNN